LLPFLLKAFNLAEYNYKNSYMGKVRFNLRKDKPLSDGVCPIDMVYQIQGKRVCYRTKYKSYPQSWNEMQQKALFLNKKEAKKLMPNINSDSIPLEMEISELNTNLANLKLRVKQIENRFEEDNICYSARNVIDKIKAEKATNTKVDPPSNFIFSFIDQYIEDHSATRERGSLSVYNALKMHLLAFQKEKKVNVSFQNIDYSFFQSFQNFLIDHRGLSNTTVAKQLSTIKTFIGYAKNQGIEVSDQYKNFKIKKESLEVITLTNEEFEKLFYLDLSTNKKFDKVRDIFCFACTTGLRYSDLAQLKHEHIKDDHIILTVKKTKERLAIPLTPYSKIILAKYKAQMQPLPKMSNQKLNDYLKGWEKKDKNGKILKEIGLCEMAGINEPIEIVRFRGTKRETNVYPKYELIGVHTGRKTFVTLSLEKGMSAEEVMSISGHKDYKSFKRYVNITGQRKKTSMQKAWQLEN
jgi:site-specific recombinase XerD